MYNKKIEWVDGEEVVIVQKYHPKHFTCNKEMLLWCVIILGDGGGYSNAEPIIHHFASEKSAMNFIEDRKAVALRSFLEE